MVVEILGFDVRDIRLFGLFVVGVRMKFLLLFLLLLGSFLGVSAQVNSALVDLPADFVFSEAPEDPTIVQLLPRDEVILSKADLGEAYRALGMIAQPSKDNFGLILVNVQEHFELQDQLTKPFKIYVGDTAYLATSTSILKQFRGKKYKVEYLTAKLTRESFTKIVEKIDVFVIFGDITAGFSEDNLAALRFLQTKLAIVPNKETETSTSLASKPTTETPRSTGDVQVRGYYRRDGTYVRPHRRSRPRN